MGQQADVRVVESTGTTWVTLIEKPPAGTVRIIKSIQVYNADTAAIDAYCSLYDDTTDWIQAMDPSIAADRSGFFLYLGQIMVQTSDYALRVKLGAAVATNEAQFSAHFADERQEGDRID